jgi:hypothetical protein
VQLPAAWAFCRRRRHVSFQAGDQRDPAWSDAIE